VLQQRHLRRFDIGTHRPQNGKKTGPFNQSKTVREEETKTKKEENFRAECRRKSNGRKRNLKPTVFPHYHSAADKQLLLLNSFWLFTALDARPPFAESNAAR